MKKLIGLLTLAALFAPTAPTQNLLTNGDFNVADPLIPNNALGWGHWSVAVGWSNLETLGPPQLDPTSGSHGGNDNTGIYDFTPQVTSGTIAGDNYSGVYQNLIPSTIAAGYIFSFDAGAEAWWLPWGEYNVVFYDTAMVETGRTTLCPTDPLNNATNGGIGDFYDKGIVYRRYSFLAATPPNTVSLRAELVSYGQANGRGTWGGGNNWLDNASLTEAPAFSGTVNLQNFGADLTKVSLKFDIYVGGVLVETVPGYLTASGTFVAPTTQTGTVQIVAKGSHWLGQQQTVTIGGAPIAFDLINGDVDGDNVVSVFDYIQLSDAFDADPTMATWNAAADLDGDEVVSVFDYIILSDNFDKSGDPS